MKDNTIDNTAVIVLAAGRGTRMKSEKAKVLHNILNKPMILHVLASAVQILPAREVIVVVGHQSEAVKSAVLENFAVRFAYQEEQLGTGHAIKCAVPCIADHVRNVVIMCGDVPLVKPETIRQFLSQHIAEQNDLTVLAMQLDNPAGYGRLQLDNHQLAGIIEEADTTPAQKKISIVNAGMYCVTTGFMKDAIKKISADNAQGEYYLTDIVKIGFEQKKSMGVFLGQNSEEFKGVNTLQELKAAEQLLKSRFV